MNTETIHRDAILIDAVAPLLQKLEHVDTYIAGGVTCVAPTVAVGGETSATALGTIARWLT